MRSFPATFALALLLCGCTAGDEGHAPSAAAMDDIPGRTPPADRGPPGGQDPSVPERYRGDWAADVAACERPGEVSRLSIGQREIRFHESEGPIVSVEESGDTLEIVARLSGEGETRDAAYAFTLSADGNTLTDATGYARQRCGR